MRILKKLRIFFRLKFEEIASFIWYHVKKIPSYLVVVGGIMLLIAIVFMALYGIGYVTQSVTGHELKEGQELFEVGMFTTILIGIIIAILVYLFKAIKVTFLWLRDNWQKAEKELSQGDK